MSPSVSSSEYEDEDVESFELVSCGVGGGVGGGIGALGGVVPRLHQQQRNVRPVRLDTPGAPGAVTP